MRANSDDGQFTTFILSGIPAGISAPLLDAGGGFRDHIVVDQLFVQEQQSEFAAMTK